MIYTVTFNPSLDYIVAKFPRFPFDKFTSASNQLGTQMKATGEVMGIGSTLEECVLKSVRSLETGVCHLWMKKFAEMVRREIPGAMVMGASACMGCKQCTYPDAPCRFPDKLSHPMEGLGMIVSDVCKANGVKYYYGPGTLTYTGCILTD